MTETPECDKMLAIQDKSLILSGFVDWLKENGYAICEQTDYEGSTYPRIQWVPQRKSYEELFANYFEIDLKKVEQEKQAILAEIRSKG